MWLSFSVRYDELYVFRENDLIIIFCCLVIFYSSTFFFGIYNQIFRYASYSAALQVTYAVIVYGFLSLYYCPQFKSCSVGMGQEV